LSKDGLEYNLGDFFTNSSLVALPPRFICDNKTNFMKKIISQFFIAAKKVNGSCDFWKCSGHGIF
jgi:hypothetical protein